MTNAELTARGRSVEAGELRTRLRVSRIERCGSLEERRIDHPMRKELLAFEIGNLTGDLRLSRVLRIEAGGFA